ncbi:S-adenosyl-l-methionine hydroxide adenosyltransferase family protein [Micromonospora sp. NPDC006431]|uniref:SAM hydrolase/SAM-dependent halogenase family protein n=1 Tax=Micromonospora sp. NPDC006431 TaxID=3364235 RepID=UPI0036950AE3
MSRPTCISLTTDYGLADGFVAACHGVLARLAPAARVIDVTHLVPPADVRRGAVVLAQTVPYLPEGVHVAVVDPGVGTARRAIGLATPNGLLVGPDNGLLLDAAAALGGITAAVELTNPTWLAPAVSRTFHGRDVFAPVAARLALGAPLAEAGPALDPATLVRLPAPVLHRTADGFAAEVLTVDHFGNVQLAAPADLLDGLPDRVRVTGRADRPRQLGAPDAAPLRQPQLGASDAAPRPEAVAEAVTGALAMRGRTFADAPVGELVVYPDSAGLLAVAVNTGRAVDRLGVRPGDVVTVTRG